MGSKQNLHILTESFPQFLYSVCKLGMWIQINTYKAYLLLDSVSSTAACTITMEFSIKNIQQKMAPPMIRQCIMIKDIFS